MNKLPSLPLLFVLSSILLCCSPVKEESNSVTTDNEDSTQLVKTFVYGLWSMDSGNTLMNEGYFFRSDGSLDFISSEMSGRWEVKGNDTLKIEYDSINETFVREFHIDSLNESRMVLSNSDGEQIFRKVPFGLNMDGNIISGFNGFIAAGQSKEYSVNLPYAKKIAVKMMCADSSVTFRIYDSSEREITSAPVHNWAGIVIRSGSYKLVLSKPEKSKWNEDADYDVKVLVY